MQLKALFTQAVLASLLPSAFADCQLANKMPAEKVGYVEQDEWLCLPMNEGSWTFAMELSEVVFPSFSASSPWAGLASTKGFAIYDNTCTLRATYSPTQTNDCGLNYVIMENFLPLVLTVHKVNFDVANGYFAFYYGDGNYVINNNQCDCKEGSDDTGLGATSKCKCGFQLDGNFDGKKRGIGFEA